MTPIPGVPIFTWCPAPDSGGTISLRILKAQFGDGYQQRAGDGINAIVQSWPVQFIGKPEKIAAIANFLKERAGYKAFHWTPPDGELLLFACDSISIRKSTRTVSTLAATFEQVFRA